MARTPGQNRQKDVARVLREKIARPRGGKPAFKVRDIAATNSCQPAERKRLFG